MDVVSLGGLPLALVKMPVPEFHPCAHFVGIVAPSPAKMDQPGKGSDARYFTLEQAAPHLPYAHTHGVFCEWTPDGTHRNFDELLPLDGGQAFLSRIQHQLANPDIQAVCSSKPS
jgi:hypothetical protein